MHNILAIIFFLIASVKKKGILHRKFFSEAELILTHFCVVQTLICCKFFRKLKRKQDGNVPSRRHILGSKIFKEQLFEIFGKKFFFEKIVFEFFFEKVFFKSHNAEKLKKRPFRLIQRFLQTENFKKMQGGTL